MDMEASMRRLTRSSFVSESGIQLLEQSERLNHGRQAKGYLNSAWTLLLLVMVTGFANSYVFTFATFYIKALCPNTSNTSLSESCFFAAFSLGQMVGSWMFGKLSAKHPHNHKMITVVTSVVLALSFFGVGYGNLWPQKSRVYVIIIMRFIGGVCGGIVTLVRFHFSALFTNNTKKAAQFQSMIAGSQAMGQGAGSVLGSAFSFFGEGSYSKHYPIFDAYTLPSYFLGALTIANLVYIVIIMKNMEDMLEEALVPLKEVNGKKRQEGSSTTVNKTRPMRWILAFSLTYCWFVGYITSNGMILTEMLTAELGWNSEKSIGISGIILFGGVICATVSYVSAVAWNRKRHPKRLLLAAVFFITCSSCMYLPLFTDYNPASLSPNTTSSDEGCHQAWCTEQNALTAGQIVMGQLFAATSFGFMITSVPSVYVEAIQGTTKEASYYSFQTFGGALARLSSPLVNVNIFHYKGARALGIYQVSVSIGAAVAAVIVNLFL